MTKQQVAYLNERLDAIRRKKINKIQESYEKNKVDIVEYFNNLIETGATSNDITISEVIAIIRDSKEYRYCVESFVADVMRQRRGLMAAWIEESGAIDKKKNEEMELLNQEVQALRDKIMFDDAPSAIAEMINLFEKGV